MRDEISFIEARDEWGELSLVAVTGRLRCANGVTFGIDNRLDVRRDRHNRHEVRTLVHRYHAWQTVGGVARDVLRIDMAPCCTGTCSTRTARRYAASSWQPDEIPTLDAIIREAIALAHT